ncbi:MAG: relaxase domain-containing protein [Phycisphaeraceae bacterium]|nr:relaxase domain-containing protein [Phycisphaerales bacterium]MCB9842326.1 relaxase domain-containing protein [Phycisphaeraceae bacterium]
MNAQAAQSYFTQGLAREDYYTKGQEIAGRWGGLGAQRLGFGAGTERTEVTRADFKALTDNRVPGTDQRLTPRDDDPRTVGYDLNFHAPKGVSLLYAIHKDDRILEAFRGAVDETMREIERHAETRVRLKGQYTDRDTGNLVWAEFVHLTARPNETHDLPDPHLHAHCFVINATFDPVEGRWKAGQFRRINQDCPYYQAAFHVRLANRLRALGYEVDRTQKGWDLAGVPRELTQKYSNRTTEIERFADAKGIIDPVARGALGARTRRAKQTALTMPELQRAWGARLELGERALLKAIDDRGRGGGVVSPPGGDGGPGGGRVMARQALEWAVRHCFERRSAYPLKRLVADAAMHGLGRVTVEDLWAEVPKLDLVEREVRGQSLVTTRAILEEERAVLGFAVDGKATQVPVRARIVRESGEDWRFRDDRLDTDQRRVVDHVLDSTDRVVMIRGAAGTGKTTLMTEAIAAIRAGAQSVVVVAPTAEAARGEESLRSKGFKGAETVAKLLDDERYQKGLRNGNGGGVLWVDEAGLLGTATLRRVFEVAEKHDARVVLCGDARQHKAVERGDALRVLERRGGIVPAELVNIRRQQGEYREAIAALSSGDTGGGLARLDGMGAIHEEPDHHARIAAAARDYVSCVREGRSVVAVCPTHYEGGRVAQEIRGLLREEGMIQGKDREFTRLRDLNWSEAAREDARSYEPGLVVRFHQAARGVVAGDRCDVLGRGLGEDGREVVRARTPRGVEIDLPLDQAARFQVYGAEPIHLAVGDQVRITRNGPTADKRGRVFNGAVHTVQGFTQHGAIELSPSVPGGRPKILPKEFGHFAYGMVRTSHAAQGKDADHALIIQSAASVPASDAAQFYVSASRGKKSIAVYTDDKALLHETAKRTADRMSGTELAGDGGVDPALVRSATPALRKAQQTAIRKSHEAMRERAKKDAAGKAEVVTRAPAKQRAPERGGRGMKRDR